MMNSIHNYRSSASGRRHIRARHRKMANQLGRSPAGDLATDPIDRESERPTAIARPIDNRHCKSIGLGHVVVAVVVVVLAG